MLVRVALLVVLAASGPLQRAEQAYAARDFQDVLPALAEARKQKLDDAQLARADELEAFTHAAFDETELAIASFRAVLRRNPDYAPPTDASPKVRGLFDEAQRRELAVHPRPPKPQPAPQLVIVEVPAKREPAIYERWWFWAGIGVFVTGAAAATYVETRPHFPSGNLGQDNLP